MYDVSDLYLLHEERDVMLTKLRAQQPIAYDEQNDLWYMTKYADIVHVSRHPDVFSSAQGISYFPAVPLGMVTMDDPGHTRLRHIVSKAFTPRMVSQLRDRTREYAVAGIDAIAADGEGDFVDAIAAPVTLRIIADMLGIPHDELDDVRRWTDRMMDAGGRLDEPGVAVEAAENFVQWTEYVSSHITRRVADPGDDLLSALAHAEDDNLDLEELAMFATLLMVAGNETTRHTTTRGVEALIRHPLERRKWATDPDVRSVGTEEILRWTSVARGMLRTVVSDTQLSGVELPAGARLFLAYPSANRDEEIFDDPFSFRLDRDPNPQLAFGIGTHYCLGAGLARMEVETILTAVLERLPDIDFAPGTEPVHRANGLVAGVSEMPVVFSRS